VRLQSKEKTARSEALPDARLRNTGSWQVQERDVQVRQMQVHGRGILPEDSLARQWPA